jgi:basic amino acid/polyamine antiporter, APA family
LVAAQALFGNAIGSLMGGIISILLVSTISSMIFTGPRVLKSMFERMNVGRILAVENNQGSPQNAIFFQGVMSLIMLFTMDFESLIYYVAFTLSLFTLLTVFGMIKMRFTHGKPSTYRAFGYPFTPIIFIVMTGTVAWFFMNDKTTESLMGLGTALFGLLMWKFSKSSTSPKAEL